MITSDNAHLFKRLLDISFKEKLHHLGSYFSSLLVIDEIYSKMNLDEDIFILSSGHASLALYVVLEKYYGFDAEKLLSDCGEHPKLDEARKIFCSTGSLGMGLPVAIGRALANPKRTVNCLISDGECSEGSIWESLEHIERLSVSNINVYVNLNGVSGYNMVDIDRLSEKLISFNPAINLRRTDPSVFSIFSGIDSHYLNLSKENYNKVRKEIESFIS